MRSTLARGRMAKLLPRQADRHREQFARTTRRRQCGETPAEHPAGHFGPDTWSAGDLSQRRRRRLRRQGATDEGVAAEGAPAIYRRLRRLHRKTEQIGIFGKAYACDLRDQARMDVEILALL